MKRLILAAALACAAATVPAAPKAADPSECNFFADMAIVVRALSAVGVAKEKAREVIPHIYLLPDNRVVEIAAAVLDAGYRDQRVAREFATELGRACMSGGGNMDSVLGVPS
jgi:hypothetical protein